ncbi:MAG TPA: amino acid permease [Pricia sp.]|nr:amino acid permease [Pricia sp.]
MKNDGKTGLSRKLGLFSLTNIVVANMIGAGIFTTSGLLMGELHNPFVMILLWVVGGAIALCGAMSYGELGAAMPQAGGEYTFLSKLFHPIFGFLSGWVSFIVGFSAPIAASAIGFSEYLFHAFPQLSVFFDFPEQSLKNIVSILVIVLFSLVHLRGLRFGSLVQDALTLLKVALVIGLILAGFLLGSGDFSHFETDGLMALDFGGWKTLGLSLMWIMFAYSGWNASTYIGSEIRNPEKNLPRSLLLGTGLVMLLYLLLNVLFIYALPPRDMEGVIAIGGLAVDHLFVGSMDTIVSLLIAFALFSSLSAFIIIGPRVYYAMARDGYFFKFLAEIHPVFKVPAKAILIQAFLSIVIVLTGTFDQILTYMGFALGIFPILAVIGVFRLRRSGRSVLKLPGYPWVQLLYLSVSLFILMLALFERPMESSIALMTVLIGIPLFFIFKRVYRNRDI